MKDSKNVDKLVLIILAFSSVFPACEVQQRLVTGITAPTSRAILPKNHFDMPFIISSLGQALVELRH